MSAATRLRRNDEDLRIVVLERGPHVSFANCGLPYHLGGVIEDRDDLLQQTPASLAARFAIDVRVRQEVVGIDREARTVRVRDLVPGTDYSLGYDALVIATGAAPVPPEMVGAERAHVLRDIDDMDRIQGALSDGPRSAVVIGGGFVGLEVAENLLARGLAVSVVELSDQVLPPLDPELAALVADRLTSHGVAVHTGARAVAVEDDKVELSDGTMVAADLVVSAVGVRPESGLARAAGLTIGERGGMVVDDEQRTSDPAVFAVGDVAEKRDAVVGGTTLVPLAQTANRHGRLVADVITGRATPSRPVLGTAILRVLGLTAAVTGWSERRLRAAGRDARAIHTHPVSHAGYYPGAEAMALKLLLDPATDRILGAQAVGGEGVDKRIDVIATAMRAGLTGSDLADLELAYAPQVGSAKDPVNMLGYIADNLHAGLTETVQWHELEREVADGALLVDVRSPAEHAGGRIPGAVNLPVDELRHRMADLPDRRLVVHCAVGARGHVAVRMLRQAGYDAVNLDGGFRTWSAGISAGHPSGAERPGGRPAQ
ncbi:MAG: FAD-dependent oxidoreductase [Nocardioidaceae bacterium]|nr:FAD-dependent oxidoreductase [Nocardioidaceae bacterium]NUS52165.1 FAD-dependent oxidoreductase [Nocardioidaceae bacterium]